MSCGRVGGFYLSSETFKKWNFKDKDLETDLVCGPCHLPFDMTKLIDVEIERC
jgi:hypothetical protein